jgi:TP901 family phage tail tape measure protein
MAGDTRKILDFVFVGVDEMSSTLDSIAGGMDEFNTKIQGVAGPLGDFSERLVKTEAAVIAAGAALAAYAIGEAVKFQSATIDLKKVLDDTDPSIEGFKDAAIGLSNAFGVAATDVLQSTAEFKQAGFTAEEALALVEHGLTLVNVSELTAAQSAELFVRLLKGYNAPASDAARILDILNEVSNVYAVNVGQLGEAMARSAPIAAQMGFSYEELAGVMTPMVETFQSSELAATAFNTVMQRLVGDSAPVVSTLEELGISQKDLNGNMKSGKDILTEVQLAFSKLTPEMKLVHAQELAGVEQAAKMVITFDQLEKVTGVTATALNSVGSAQKELNVRMEAAEVIINKATEAWHNAAILFGEELLPEFSEVVKGLGAIGIAIQNAVKSGAFDPLIDAGKAALKDLSLTFQQIAAALPEALKGVDFTQLIEAFEDLGLEIGGIFKDVDLKTPEGLRVVIQKLIDGLTSLTHFTSGFVSSWAPVVRGILDGTGAFAQLSPEVQKAFGAFGGAMSVISHAEPLIKGTTSAIELLAYAMGANGIVGAARLALPALAALTGPVGIGVAGAAALVASDYFLDWSGSIVTAGKSMLGLSPSVEDVGKALLTQKTGTEDLTGAMGAMIGSAAAAALKNDELTAAQQAHIAAVYAGIPTFSLLDDTLARIGDTYVEVADQQKTAADKVKSAAEIQTDSIDALLDRWTEADDSARDLSLATELSAAGFKAQSIAVHDSETGALSYVDAITFAGDKSVEAGDKASTALSQTAEETLKAQEAANDFALKWEELASQERQVQFEVGAQVQIAQIEAATERIKAAFESVNVTIESTGSTLVGLAGILADVGSGSGTGRVIIDLMEEENRRRQEALDLQEKLITAQVNYMNAVVDQMIRGEAMIQITSDGLEHDLETIMMTILKKVQIKANESAQQFLLGLNG